MIATKQEIKTILNMTSMAQEEQIDQLIPVIESDIREYCNNAFRDKRVYLASGEISFTHNSGSADTINLDIGTNEDGFVESQFKAGQTVQVQGSYNNNNFFEIETVSSTALTLYTPAKRPYYPVLVTEDEDVLVLVYKVEYPSALKNIVAQMVNYKLTNRDYGVQSETVARYSVTYNTEYANGYPKRVDVQPEQMAEAGVCMISDYYTESFTVEAATTAKSTIGSWAPVWATMGTFKGFMDYLNGRESFVAAQYLDKATHIIGAPSTCTWILNRHRIKDSDGLIYRVLHVDNPIRRDHHLEILLEYNESDNLST